MQTTPSGSVEGSAANSAETDHGRIIGCHLILPFGLGVEVEAVGQTGDHTEFPVADMRIERQDGEADDLQTDDRF
jgi:hypothetical protein